MPPSFVSLEGPEFDYEHSHQLAVRLQLLPYETESEERADELLDAFITKTIAATNAKDIDSIVQWGVEAMQEYVFLTRAILRSNMSRRWSVLRRSMTRSKRAAIVKFFYQMTRKCHQVFYLGCVF